MQLNSQIAVKIVLIKEKASKLSFYYRKIQEYPHYKCLV